MENEGQRGGAFLMAVYVDDAQNPFGRMKMCHMIADTTLELMAMADRIGVKAKWVQYYTEAKEHFDICQAKRALAIENGAVPISQRDLVKRQIAKARSEEHC